MSRALKNGQSLSEYSLIALVVVITLPALVLLGNNVESLFGDFEQSLVRKPVSLQVASTNQNRTAPSPVVSSDPMIPLPDISGSKMTITTANGNTIEINNYTSPPPLEAVVTVGANGTTEMLASTMVALAQQLKDSGEITEAQYNDIIKLANQGHRIAQIEGLIEQAAKEVGNAGGSAFSDYPLAIDGKQFTVLQALEMIGYTQPVYGMSGRTVERGGEPFPETQAFIALRDQVLQSGAMTSNPAVKAILENLSANILAISKASVDAASTSSFDGGGIDAYSSYTRNLSESAQVEAAALATHTSSAGICTTGSGMDSGIQCSVP